jgi:hypothetical protein
MIKPSEWDTTEVITGDFKKLPLGGHVLQIKNAKVDTTTTGKEVLIIQFDISNGEYANYYAEDFHRRFMGNPDAKYQGVYRQLTEGNSLRFFKGLITAVENSNQGYIWNWDEKSLQGKFFGGVFGEKQYLNNKGESKMSTKCFYIRSVDQILAGVDIPKPKMLKTTGNYDTSSIGDDVEVPWA